MPDYGCPPEKWVSTAAECAVLQGTAQLCHSSTVFDLQQPCWQPLLCCRRKQSLAGLWPTPVAFSVPRSPSHFVLPLPAPYNAPQKFSYRLMRKHQPQHPQHMLCLRAGVWYHMCLRPEATGRSCAGASSISWTLVILEGGCKGDCALITV